MFGPVRRDPTSGLSLIEMLIVLVIIGIGTSAAVLGVTAAGRDRRAEDEAGRLAAYLDMAVDEGLVSRHRLALFWTPGSYEAKRWTTDGWAAAETPGLVRAHVLPVALGLRRGDGETGPVAVTEDGLGPAAVLEVFGSGPAWIVAFDGLSATARQAGTP